MTGPSLSDELVEQTRGEVEQAVAATIKQYAAAFYLDCAGGGDGLMEKAANKLAEYASRAAIETPAIQRLLERDERMREELEHFVEIIDGTDDTGFSPSVEQMLMDAAETSRRTLSQEQSQ